ncbi:TonB-dependent receptor family protein [Longimicrobium terrae]|uniref:Iron complex outermembrane receptor protein n=1 Tax=Longimicrobium terrae TaxID=1639882 RepID=A0A841GZ99_9BACT|nr:TonB-dependent receptor [Longimicrobium terrae]MBB4636911.1 iron complex outermembrane receptor protein [Longimicrobium terrae]MBB6071090.1 iron complex outermembrane receptor protein [Longimicrobium terrae]NNC29141.1 TonB-dependent receptor [Longimicrobium terrae]
MISLRFAAAVLAAAFPSLALAQADTARVQPLDTVTVQALGSPIPALRAPFPVSVVRGAEIRQARAGLALSDALSAIPGVQVDNRFNYAVGERISIRGFGARAQFGVRGVRVLVDGIPATLPDGQTTLNHVDPAALERAEVIRGPASALYGNASGGVIRLTSIPAPDAPLATEHRVVGGSDGLLRLESSAGGRSGSATYRAWASRLRYDGYRRHADADNLLGGGSVGWTRGADELGATVNFVRYEARNPGSLSDSLLRVDRSQAFARNVEQRTGEEGRQAQLGLSWRRTMGAGALDVSAYGVGRSLDNPIPTNIIDLSRRVLGGRAAWTGGAGPLRWTAGAEGARQADERRTFGNQAGERGAAALDQRERVGFASAFAQGTAALGRLQLLGALRYDRFRFSVDDRLVAADNPNDSGGRTLSALSPALGVSVAVMRDVSLYANVATAFETPTTTELANRPSGAGGFNPELDAQRTTSLEVGGKARLAAWAWVEAAAYHARVRDALIPFEVEGAPGRVFYRNAGRARHRGVESSLILSPRPGWTARAAYTWTDARFGRYVVGDADRAGTRVPGIAPHRVEASLLASPARGPFAGIDARYVSATPVADADREGRLASPAYALLDARVGWEGAARGRVSPFIGVTNLLDREYNTSVVVNAFGGRYYEPGPGRALITGLRLSFRR